MKNVLLTVICLLTVSNLFSQCPYLKLPKQGKSLLDFVPKSWFLKDSVSGDYNGDGKRDYVLLLAPKIEETQDTECNRPVVILQGSATGYSLATYTTHGVLCKQCGGVFGEPFEGMSLKKNVLQIRHYAGSNWRWSMQTTFRFQKNQWQLIGYSYITYFTAGECEEAGSAAFNQYEANFSTGKAHIINTKDDACVPYRDVWKTFKKKAPVLFGQYKVSTDYFPFKK